MDKDVYEKAGYIVETSLGSDYRTRNASRQAQWICRLVQSINQSINQKNSTSSSELLSILFILNIWTKRMKKWSCFYSKVVPRSLGLVQEVCVACWHGSAAGEVCVETSVMQLRCAICCNTVTSWCAKHSLPSPPCSSTNHLLLSKTWKESIIPEKIGKNLDPKFSISFHNGYSMTLSTTIVTCILHHTQWQSG